MPATTSVPFTLRVEDLGRLAEAEVELRPMTLFVGENNSGKSYLATLFWTALRPERHSILQHTSKDPDWLEAREAAQTLVDECVARARRGEPGSLAAIRTPQPPSETGTVQSYTVDLRGDDRWGNWAARIAERRLPGRLCDVLAATHIQPKVTIRRHGWGALPVVVRVDLGETREIMLGEVRIDMIVLYVGAEFENSASFLAQVLLDCAIGEFPWPSQNGVDQPEGALYFPASRTAFLQNLPELTDRQLERSFQRLEDRLPTRMVAPVRQFLRFLVNPGELRPDDKGLAALIEGKVIGGSFQRGPGIDYQYTPTGLSTPLPMHLTSSVVTELLPLWLLVSTGRRPPLLVYEEPEAHLHPRLQRVVAVVLARLARQGTKVLVTTHSETFAQQINNLIKRSGLDPETRAATAVDFPYEADDYLSPEDVAGYEFRFREDGRSYTERLEVRPDGIVMPMFNKELLALTDEAIRLDEALAAKQAGG